MSSQYPDDEEGYGGCRGLLIGTISGVILLILLLLASMFVVKVIGTVT